uniref:Pirin n=1 Tax=Aureoumbra lagunensis TaxID=44058 RepID=A0A7S3JZ77_9STRA|mmetsp:Transcript_16840/g.25346  ORF Transcript_16840/g.25346 Transcript_16840/m.25346 type:complete len:346 (-) Transcript_16840:319-1356(-)
MLKKIICCGLLLLIKEIKGIEMDCRQRIVSTIVRAHRQLEGGGFEVRRPFPSNNVLGEQFDPFLLLDHLGPIEAKPGEAVGAPWHPHRGFQTISYLLEGELVHKDSAGNTGTLRPGDFQLMTAGAGVIHDESPSDYVKQHGGRSEGFQIWVNLRKVDKMIEPYYQDFAADSIPIYQGERFIAKIAAGTGFDLTGPVETKTPIQFIDVHAEPDAIIEHSLPMAFSLGIYVYRGSIIFPNQPSNRNSKANEGDFAVLENVADDSSTGTSLARIIVPEHAGPTKFLILAGIPLRESIARAGPFVMNTQAELRQAFLDYQSGNFAKIPATFKSKTRHTDKFDPTKHKLV